MNPERIVHLKPRDSRNCFDQRPIAVHVVYEDDAAWRGRAGRVLELGLKPSTYPKFAWQEVRA